MLTPQLTRVPPRLGATPGRVDPSRVAAPWMWNGLCVAINAFDGTLRDWASGAAPSAQVTPTIGKDNRGNETATFTGSAVAPISFADNGAQSRPATALTVFARFLPNGVTPASGVIAAKPYTNAVAPFDTWQIVFPTANSTVCQFTANTTTTYTAAANSTALPTTAYTNIFGRWESGGRITCDFLTDAGAAAVAQTTSAANQSGSLLYVAPPLPLRIGQGETPTKAAAGGALSTLMMWARRLSDPEMRAVSLDPFGFIRRP